MINRIPKQSRQKEQGITLVETVVSLLIFMAVLAGLVPAYMSYRLRNIQNPVRIGAVSVSQQILDEIRQVKDVNTLPNDGLAKTTTAPAPRNTDLTNLTAYGKNYSVQVTYCETVPVDKSGYCSLNARYIDVRVFQRFSNGTVSTNPVYQVSTVYTKFEQ
jgi:type II secretory pathway pseudopilin PulG